MTVPAGWLERNGDLRDGDGPHAKYIAYRAKGGWMVMGVRTAEELAAIAEWVAAQPVREAVR